MSAGNLDSLRGQTVMLSNERAEADGVAAGDTVQMNIAGYRAAYPVVGLYEATPAIGSDVVTTVQALEQASVVPTDSVAYVVRQAGADPAAVTAGIEQVIADLPTVTLKDQAEFAAEQRGPIDQMLYLIYALLGLAVVIAVLGIVNTLALSVIERTRELGLLRAVGMSRRQLRRMVRLESSVIALVGAVLGVVLGTGFGVALQRSQADAGVAVLSVPWSQLMVFVVLAGVVGVLAALWPARRASRLDVLQAIAAE